jgi:hypothetical protein
MKKIAISAALLAMVGAANAQSTGSSFSNVRSYLKKSPVSLAFENVTETNKAGASNKGYVNWLYPQLSYKMTANDSLRFMTEIETLANDELKDGQEVTTNTNFLELRYKRASILTEDQNGISLAVELRARYNPNADVRRGSNQAGTIQPRIVAAKSLSEDFGVTGIFRFDNYLSNDNQAEVNGLATGLEEDYKAQRARLYVIPEYSVTKKAAVGITTLYQNSWFDSGKADEGFIFEPYVSYKLGNSVSATLYGGNYLMKSRDGDTFASNYVDHAWIGTNIAISAF